MPRRFAFIAPLTFPALHFTLIRMDESIRQQLKPGARVTVTQQIAGSDWSWSSQVQGTVLDYEQRQTGSWYAHSKNDKLWLDRLKLRKADGEITTLNLDEYSRIEIGK
jgi:hypothetical protein